MFFCWRMFSRSNEFHDIISFKLSSLLFLFYNLICCGGSQSGCNVLEYQNQAKMLFRKLGPQSPTRCSIETGPYLFQWVLPLLIFLFVPYFTAFSCHQLLSFWCNILFHLCNLILLFGFMLLKMFLVMLSIYWF